MIIKEFAYDIGETVVIARLERKATVTGLYVGPDGARHVDVIYNDRSGREISSRFPEGELAALTAE